MYKWSIFISVLCYERPSCDKTIVNGLRMINLLLNSVHVLWLLVSDLCVINLLLNSVYVMWLSVSDRRNFRIAYFCQLIREWAGSSTLTPAADQSTIANTMRIFCIKFHPNNQYIFVSGGWDNHLKVCFWNKIWWNWRRMFVKKIYFKKRVHLNSLINVVISLLVEFICFINWLYNFIIAA